MRFEHGLHEVSYILPTEAQEKMQIEGNVFALAAPGAAGIRRKQLMID